MGGSLIKNAVSAFYYTYFQGLVFSIIISQMRILCVNENLDCLPAAVSIIFFFFLPYALVSWLYFLEWSIFWSDTSPFLMCYNGFNWDLCEFQTENIAVCLILPLSNVGSFTMDCMVKFSTKQKEKILEEGRVHLKTPLEVEFWCSSEKWHLDRRWLYITK